MFSNPERLLAGRARERGQVMLALLLAAALVTVIGVSLVGLMNTDMSHAAVQYAVSRSFFIAQAGLEDAKAHVYAAPDPATDATAAGGVTVPYGGGRFTYWVDAGPATGCGMGLKTLEALGQVASLNRMIPTRIRACAVPGVPFLTALFGASRVQFQGTSRTYLAPYGVGTPAGGGNLGSFTEINFSGNDVRLNALSEDAPDTVTVRDGTFADYTLFGFPTRPHYNPTPTAEPDPWILAVDGDVIKAQPIAGPTPNPCGGPYACVTVGSGVTDVRGVADLREANYLRHVYVRRLREEAVRPLSLDSASFERQAEQNTVNASLNELMGLSGKADSHYARTEIQPVMVYLARHPGQYLRGVVYFDGTVSVVLSVDVGGPSGNVTLAVGGDLVIRKDRALTNRHDLTTVSGRRTPGIIVFGTPEPSGGLARVCGGRDELTGSGRFVMCEGSTLVVDGLVYTQDGMAIEPQASVDQVGAMYHGNRFAANPSFTARDATIVLRFDPLALSVFGNGLAILSWQQLH